MDERSKKVLSSEARSVVVWGDCLEVLMAMPDASVDSVVTDPPGAIDMDDWDDDKGDRPSWIAWMAGIFRQSLRVQKQGTFALIWSIPRTSWWTATALNEAGYEIMDCLYALTSYRKPASAGRLRPGADCWWIARKPTEKSSSLNVDLCRIPRTSGDRFEYGVDGDEEGLPGKHVYGDFGRRGSYKPNADGRWPSSLILVHGGCAQDCAVRLVDELPGPRSRFFYAIRPSAQERDDGLPIGTTNEHSTVKPMDLMRYLCRLVTVPGGVILDPFAGSGSTGCAAVIEGFRFIGIEQSPEYVEIARARIAHWQTRRWGHDDPKSSTMSPPTPKPASRQAGDSPLLDLLARRQG